MKVIPIHLTIIIINRSPRCSRSIGKKIGTLPVRIYTYRVRWRLGPGRAVDTKLFSFTLKKWAGSLDASG